MKKKLVLSILFASLFFVQQAYCSEAQELYEHLATCTQGTFDDGRKITTILGWSNRKCYFSEFTYNTTISCGLKINDLAHFTNNMVKEFDFKKGLTSTKANRVFFQDQEMCKLQNIYFN